MKNNKILFVMAASALVAACGNGRDAVHYNDAVLNPKSLHYTYPLDNQTQVSPRAIVALNFNGSVDASAANFTITGPGGANVPFTYQSVDSGHGVVLKPNAALLPASNYSVTMNGVQVDSTAVNFPDGSLDFETRAALEGPVSEQKTASNFEVESIFPDDKTFKTMDFSTLRLRTTQPIDKSSAVYGSTIKLMHNGSLVPALLLVKGSAITVDPNQDMTPGDTYTLTVDGLTTTLGGATIASYSRTLVPEDTGSPTTGERAVLVTKAAPADDCKNPTGTSVSPLTGQAINCVPVIGTLLQNQTVSKQSGDIFGELAYGPNFPKVTPLRVKKGGILVGDALEVFIGGKVPVGFNSGKVTVQQVADATGYLYPNPNSDSPSAPKNLRLFMDVSTSTADARANGAFTQNLMHLELVGTAIIKDGVLKADAVTVVEPRVLGVENSYGILSFHMESYVDQLNAPAQPADTVNPFVPVLNGDNGPELSWQPGNVADRMVPGEPIVVHFNEALDPETIKAGSSLMLTKNGSSEPFQWRLDGNALVIKPDSPVEHGATYAVTTTPDITDLAGNPLQVLNSLDGSNTLSFTMPVALKDDGGTDVRRGPFAMTVYPGFPCASSTATQAEIDAGTQGTCLSSSPQSEQVVVQKLPIVGMPANRSIRVRFSQNMDASTVQLGTSFIVEHDNNGSWEAVSGLLKVDPRAITFTPDTPWVDGDLYRYILKSTGDSTVGGCPAGALCSTEGLPLQTALLEAPGMQDGGPDMTILFHGAPAIDTVFQELSNLPSADVNNNFQIDTGEDPFSDANGFTDDTVIDPLDTPANATMIQTQTPSGAGLVTAANTGCGFQADNSTPLACDRKKFLYVAGDLNTEIQDYDDANQGVPVVIYPTMVALTNLDATAVIGADLVLLTAGLTTVNTQTGPNIMRVRYEMGPDGKRDQPPVGYIKKTANGPVFDITFDLLFDAPALSLPFGLQHNVKSLLIPGVHLQGPLQFLPDGRLFIGLQNQEALNVNLDITLSGFPGGQVKLKIPPGAINLSYQSVSIQK
ncbi:MAG: Ig-like domain-containing protein [Alcanivorax sp.]|nr:Ig-like domain-containing protein [Alcanivorax sp.]